MSKGRGNRWYGRAGIGAAAVVTAVSIAVVSLGTSPAYAAAPARAAAPATTHRAAAQAAFAAEHVSGGIFAKVSPGLAVRRAGSGQRTVALTFDDGPSVYTPQVLDMLARAHQHATFYVTGYGATAYPGTLRRILAEGHAIGDHTVTHSQLPSESAEKQRWELASTADRVEAATGVRPTTFRPPYGLSTTGVNALARSLGLLPVTWSIDTRDWSLPGSARIAATALSGVAPGDIILMHDGGGPRSETLGALPEILRALAQRHLTSVTVPQLLNGAPPVAADLAVCAC